jgi:predicted lipid-binding transport protein (Tim44 family)
LVAARRPATFRLTSTSRACPECQGQLHPPAGANDAGNLDDIREFTTPEMFAEIKMSIDERGGAGQFTDVVSINADVLEVAEEANRYVVSVRLTGTVREDGANAEPVDEIWHLTKPRDGASGWLLAGIQQAQ